MRERDFYQSCWIKLNEFIENLSSIETQADIRGERFLKERVTELIDKSNDCKSWCARKYGENVLEGMQ